MQYVPWKTFSRIIKRHNTDAGTRTLDCADLFRIMAFAQLTWHESLRDIEICLRWFMNPSFFIWALKLHLHGQPFPMLSIKEIGVFITSSPCELIERARSLYTKDILDLDLDATIYALDSTTIDLCLILFDWAPFRTTKAAIKMHTLLDFERLYIPRCTLTLALLVTMRKDMMKQLGIKIYSFYFLLNIS